MVDLIGINNLEVRVWRMDVVEQELPIFVHIDLLDRQRPEKLGLEWGQASLSGECVSWELS